MKYNLDQNTLIKPGPLQQWVDELPYANPAGVAEQLLYALEQLNLYPKPLPNRWKLLEPFLRPFETILDTYQEIVLHQREATLKTNDRVLLEKTEKITKMLASGFKRCIQDDLLNGKVKKTEHAAPLIYWTMRTINLSRLFDFLYYRNATPRSWRELGNLYRLSRKFKILSTPIEVPTTKSLEESTIEREFLRSILLTLLDPSRLARDDIWHAYLYLCIWVPQARIIALEDAKPAAAIFLIDLKMADSIRPLKAEDKADPSKYHLVLDTSLLIYLLEDQINSMQTNPDKTIQGIPMLKGDLAEKFLQHMHQNWQGRPTRRFVRTNQRDRLIAVRGLDAVVDFLEERRSIHKQKTGAQVIQQTDMHADTGNSWSHPSSPNKKVHDTFTWYQLNISEGGMAILADATFLNKSHIGQVILAKSQSDADIPALRLGVVRRAKQKNKISMELGIEFLRGKITPIEQSPEIFGREKQTNPLPALLFLPEGGKNHTLITTKHSYYPDTLYVISNNKGSTKKVRSGELIESSRFFEQFECFPIQLHGEE